METRKLVEWLGWLAVGALFLRAVFESIVA
jgi:hypothetical protein